MGHLPSLPSLLQRCNPSLRVMEALTNPTKPRDTHLLHHTLSHKDTEPLTGNTLLNKVQ